MFARLFSLNYKLRYVVVLFWVSVAGISIPFALNVDQNLVAGGFSSDNFDSVKNLEKLTETFDASSTFVTLIFSHDELQVYDTQFRESVDLVLDDFEKLPEFVVALDYRNNPESVSEDLHTGIVSVGISSPLEESVDVISEVVAGLEPGPLELTTTGGALVYRDLVVASERDVQRGELIVGWLVLIVLLLFMRTVGGALLPLISGGVGTVIGLALVFALSRVTDVSFFALNVVTLLSIGLAIDYTVLFIYRFRDELKTSANVKEALYKTQQTSSKTVLFSAITSLLGMSSLAIFDLLALRSIALGAVVTIPTVTLVALTLTPAILGILGDKINKLTVVPKLRIKRQTIPALANYVMRYPVIFSLAVVVLLLLTAIPLFRINLGAVDASALPADFESRQGIEILVDEFDVGLTTDIEVIYEFSGSPFDRKNIDLSYNYGQRLLGIEGVNSVTSYVNLLPDFGPSDYEVLYQAPESIVDPQARLTLEHFVRPNAVLFMVSSELNPLTREAQNLGDLISDVPTGEGTESFVTGGAVFIKDLSDYIVGILPWVAGIVVFVTYLALMVLFRSLLLPLKAVILNLLSLVASFGAMVFVFQDGNLSGLLNFDANGTLSAPILVILFGVLFGVSMDYEIFLLARVAENRKKGYKNREAVVRGLLSSSGVIAASASVLIVVGVGFLSADVVLVKSFGFGLALAVLVDATLVRLILTPALMRLAGRANWYLPKWLQKALPNMGISI